MTAGKLSALFVAILMTTACGDQASPLGSGADENATETMVISPKDMSIVQGDSLSLSVMVKASDGSERAAAGPLSWDVSDSSLLRIGAGGKIVGTAPGSATVSVSGPDGKATASVEVLAQLEDLVFVMDTEEVEARAGQNVPVEFGLRVLGPDGRPAPGVIVELSIESLTAGAEGTESSHRIEPASGLTDSAGRFEATWRPGDASGEFEIVVHTAGYSDVAMAGSPSERGAQRRSIRARVMPDAPASLTLEPNDLNLAEGESAQIGVQAQDRFGNSVSAPTVSWSSSDTGVLTVSEAGKVLAEGEGAARVIAEAGDARAEVSVQVNAVLGDPFQIEMTSGNGQSSVVGTSLDEPLRVVLLDDARRPMEGRTIQWAITSGTGKVDRNETQTNQAGAAQAFLDLGPVAGDVTVVASYPSVGSVTFNLAAMAGPATRVVVSPQGVTLDRGQTMQLGAIAYDQWSNALGSPNVQWTSDDSGIVAVSSGGRLTANGSGTATILASVGGAVGDVEVEVRAEEDGSDDGSKGDSGTDDNGSDGGSDGDDGGSDGDSDSDDGSKAGSPAQITDLAVVSATTNSLQLQFTQVDDGTGSPAYYQIRVQPGTEAEYDWGVAQPVSEGSCSGFFQGTKADGLHSCTAEGLEAGVDYSVRMVAVRWEETRNAYSPLSNLTHAATAGETEPPVQATLQLSPRDITLTEIGGTASISADLVDGQGTRVGAADDVQWESSDSRIIQISEEGIVTARAFGTALIIATSACCGTDTVTVLAQEQEPTDPAGPVEAIGAEGGEFDLPNRPAGFQTVSDHRFNARDEAGWRFNDHPNYTIAPDETDPMGTGLIGRAFYQEGYVSGGSAGTNTSLLLDGHRVIYTAFWVKIDEGWQAHSSGVNKIGYAYIPGENSVVPWDQNGFLVWNYTGNDDSGEYRPQIRLQDIPMPDSQWNRSPNLIPDVRLIEGQWHFWETIVDVGTPGGADGRVQWWIDGDFVGDHGGLSIIPSDGIAELIKVAWFPIWGGRDDILAAEQSMRMARFYTASIPD